MAGPGQPPAPPKSSGPKTAPGAINIKLTPKQQQNLVAVVLLVGAVGFGYWKYFLTPNTIKIKEKSAILEQKKKELNDARNMVSKYDEFLKRATETNEKTDFINRRLPMDASISETIKEITQKATESNINILGFEPGKVTAKDEYKETEINLKFSTSYKDLGDFLTRIGYIERLTNPVKLSIKGIDQEVGGWSPVASAEARKGNMDVELSIKIYSFINKG